MSTLARTSASDSASDSAAPATSTRPKVTLLWPCYERPRFAFNFERFVNWVYVATDDEPFELDAVTEHEAENDGDEYEFTVAIRQRIVVPVNADNRAMREALANALEKTAAGIRR